MTHYTTPDETKGQNSQKYIHITQNLYTLNSLSHY